MAARGIFFKCKSEHTTPLLQLSKYFCSSQNKSQTAHQVCNIFHDLTSAYLSSPVQGPFLHSLSSLLFCLYIIVCSAAGPLHVPFLLSELLPPRKIPGMAFSLMIPVSAAKALLRFPHVARSMAFSFYLLLSSGCLL